TPRPVRRPPKRVDTQPTSHGSVAPPRPASANTSPAIRGAISPKHLGSNAIVVGNTEARPAPARVTPISTPVVVVDSNKTQAPQLAATSPINTSLSSRTRRSPAGAVTLPSSRAPQKVDGANDHRV